MKRKIKDLAIIDKLLTSINSVVKNKTKAPLLNESNNSQEVKNFKMK